MKRKNILFCIGIPGFSLKNENSAVVKYLVTLMEALSSRGYDVTFFPDEQESSPSPALPAVKKGAAAKLKKIIRSVSPFIYNSIVDQRYFSRQDALVKEAEKKAAEADMFIEFLTYGSSLGAMLKKRYDKPLLIIYDSPLEEQYREMYNAGSLYSGRIAEAEAVSVNNADTVICYSPAVQQHLLSTADLKGKTEILPCIVWKDELPRKQNNSELIIGFIGSFLKWHKVELLVKAFESVGTEFTGARLVLIGMGQEWQRIKAMVESHPFADRIVMPGFVNEGELIAWKRRITVGVMPGSNWYGSPLKLFEYAQAHIPFIAPASPTVESLFEDGKETLFIDKNDEEGSLVRHLRRLLMEDELRQTLAENAYKKMTTEFAKEHQTAIFTQIITNTLTRGVEK